MEPIDHTVYNNCNIVKMNLDDFHYRLKIYYQKNDETHAHKNTIHRYGTPSLWNT